MSRMGVFTRVSSVASLSIGAAALWLTPLLARADDAAPAPATQSTPVAQQSAPLIQAGGTSGPIVLDGALDEPDWQAAPAITLTQQNPHPGAPTPYLTTLKVLRGGNYLYFGIECTDPDPAHASIHTLQRDGDQSADDNVMIVVDSFGQHKLAYVFQVNAGGAKADGLISPGYNNSNSNTPTVDFSWNGYWDAAVKRTDKGWTAEIRINTQSLQFNNRNPVWGFNVSRYVPRELLTLVWSGISLDATPTNLQWEGQLTGIQGLDQGNGLEFDPYGVTEYSDQKHDTESFTGFDLKYNLTPELAGLFTYHTDFSEAQANSLNVSASPYAQTIPETRAFFLDGANIFTFSHNLGGNFIPFYSRNIGLVDGETVPLDEGVKMLGHAGDWTLGLLDTQMAETPISSTQTADSTNLFAGRAVYNVNSEWRVGGLVTHGDPLGVSDNTLTSLDSTWSSSTFQGDKNLNLSGWLARSSGNHLPDGDRGGYGFDAEYPNDLWYADVNYNFFGDALDPALGFLQRPGTKQSNGTLTWQPRPGADSAFSWVRQFYENVGYTYVTGLDGQVQSEDLNVNPIQFTTQGGWHLNVQVNSDYEVLAQPYTIVPNVTIPAGGYRFVLVHSNGSSPTANDFVYGYSAEAGDIYDAHYKDIFPNMAWSAPGGHFTLSLLTGWLWVYGVRSDGVLRVTELTMNYSVTPDLTLSTLTQYNSISHTTSENAILQWNIQPARTFYVVWNHGLTLNPNLLQGQQTVTGNTLVVKLVWGFY